MFTENNSDNNFWNKVKSTCLKAGRDVIEKALWLYYAAQSVDTPTWAKTTIYAALAYFISPLDAIPDITPFAGYSDDLAVLMSAVTAVALYIDDEVKHKTEMKLKCWFG